MNWKTLAKKLLPARLLDYYHKMLALSAAFIFGNPSEKLIVIGVTGTNGKSTTVSLIAKVLEAGGHKVGATSTVLFKISEREWLNDKKMTMLGRFQLQKLLKQMVNAGCRYAVIETSSQGIAQYRHLGINYDYVVFTNLTPEHIEAHAGFENYKQAKGRLFRHLTEKPHKRIAGQFHQKISVLNADDANVDYFAGFKADKKIWFSRKDKSADFFADGIEISLAGTLFAIRGQKLNLKLIGAFNIYNALAAIAIAEEEGVSFEKIKSGLESIAVVPGRMEIIDEGQPFAVIVDYAPEPASMEKLYETVKILNLRLRRIRLWRKVQDDGEGRRIIHVLGSCGGGRDKSRRPVLGKMAGENADFVIVTNEDPYDDDPLEIINEVAAGALAAAKIENKNLFKILDRRKAITKAVSLAMAGDLVLITGKGAEQAMAVANGKYIPWDDRTVVREIIREGPSPNPFPGKQGD